MKQLLLLASVAIFLSGCQLTRVEGKVDDVDVKVSTNGGKEVKPEGKFCPPGQAKKNRC